MIRKERTGKERTVSIFLLIDCGKREAVRLLR